MTDDIRRGQRAALILGDDIFKEAIRAVSDKALEDFKAAKPGDMEALQTARMMYEVTERFVNVFTNILRDGDFAARKEADAKRKADMLKAGPPKGHSASFQ